MECVVLVAKLIFKNKATISKAIERSYYLDHTEEQ